MKYAKIISKIISKLIMEEAFMEEYRPPYSITNAMLARVSSISEKLGRIGALHSLESKPHLRRNNRRSARLSSLKIEANSLSLGQVREVIAGRTVIGDRKDIQEVKNAYTAYEMLNDINPYSIADLLKLHEVMTRYTVDESGAFRKGEEGVFSGERCIFMAPPARLVPELMEKLFIWLREAHETVHPLILSSVFHYEFVFIHPFADGNGRMARLWHTAILAQWKPVFAYIPLENQIEKFQEDYYRAIAECHKAGSSDLFIEFMLEQTDRILDEISMSADEEEVASEYVKKLLSVMEYGVPYTASAIMQKLHLKSKETFRKHYMNPAIALGMVEMSVPDKPTSRNQRYIRKR